MDLVEDRRARLREERDRKNNATARTTTRPQEQRDRKNNNATARTTRPQEQRTREKGDREKGAAGEERRW
jgi:hypothetical protein